MGARLWIPEWIDLLVVIAFSLVIFYWAVSLALSPERVAEEIAKDSAQIDYVSTS